MRRAGKSLRASFNCNKQKSYNDNDSYTKLAISVHLFGAG